MSKNDHNEEGGPWQRQQQFLEERLPDGRGGIGLHAAHARRAALIQMRLHTLLQDGMLTTEEQAKLLQELFADTDLEKGATR